MPDNDGMSQLQDLWGEETAAKEVAVAIDRTLEGAARMGRPHAVFAALAINSLAERFRDTEAGTMMVYAATLLVAASGGKLARKGAAGEVQD